MEKLPKTRRLISKIKPKITNISKPDLDLDIDSRRLARQVKRAEKATIKHARRFLIRRWSNVRDVQKHIIGWVVVVSILIAATGVQLMWFQDSYKQTAPAKDGTYTEAVLGPINTLNPLYASTSAEQSASQLMFSRLMQYDSSGKLGYDLAQSVSINSGKTVYNVKIRTGVLWHDGQPLTAQDVAFTAGVMKDPAARTVITGWRDIDIQVMDEQTVRFTLNAPYSAFEHALTFPILPKHILENVAAVNIRENIFSQNPVGSGPFKFGFVQESSQALGRKVVYMNRNDNYYRGIPNLARLQLNVYESREAIAEALSRNEVNAAADVLSTNVDSINFRRYDMVARPIQTGLYAIFNTGGQITENRDVRRAIRLATDAQAIRDVLAVDVKGLYMPITNEMLPDKSRPGVPKFDLTAANKLLNDKGWKLNQAGIREKGGKELRLSAVVIKNSEYERVLDILIAQWRQAGVAVDVQVISTEGLLQDAVQTVLQPRNFDVLIYPLNIGADPDVYAYWHSSQATNQGFNFANYTNSISDEALASGRTIENGALRDAKYRTFVNRWLEDVPAIGLYQLSSVYVYGQNVKSVNPEGKWITPVGRYYNVVDWSVGTDRVYKTP